MRGLPASASSFVDGVGENTKGMLQLVPFLFDQSEQPSGQAPGSSRKSGDDIIPRAPIPIPRLVVKANDAVKTTDAVDSLLDIRNPALTSALDGVLKIGGVGAAHAASQEAFTWMRKGPLICNMCGLRDDAEAPTTRRDFEKLVYRTGKEGLQWGMVAGMYAGLEYGIEKARGGKQDWKNAAVGGALTGVLISVSDGRISQDKMVRTALTASALATAADFLKSVHLD